MALLLLVFYSHYDVFPSFSYQNQTKPNQPASLNDRAPRKFLFLSRPRSFGTTMEIKEGKSLAETPTWAVATVITLLVGIGFLINASLKKFGKWVDRTKRKHLLAVLEKIKEELMLFGLLSLLMGHWTIFVAKICVKSLALSSRFYPCAPRNDMKNPDIVNHLVVLSSNHLNSSISRHLSNNVDRDFCPKGHESFASYESLEQLHRFLFVLGVTHVSYSFIAIALAMIKIYSWRTWENHAKTLAFRGLLSVDTSNEPQEVASNGIQIRRLSSFVVNRTSHPWSQHRVLVWLVYACRISPT